jgi:hypothetical protein
MGHIADVCWPTPHDDSRSYGEGYSEVKVTRLVTGALHRPLRGNEIRSGASSKEAARRLAAHRLVVASRATTRAGSSRDGRRYSTRPDLEADRFWIKDPGTSTRASKISARRGTRRSPMLAHETSPVSGASVVGMTYGAYHEPGSMPAGVPGIPAASARGDRLHSKGRLHQRPADDSA